MFKAKDLANGSFYFIKYKSLERVFYLTVFYFVLFLSLLFINCAKEEKIQTKQIHLDYWAWQRELRHPQTLTTTSQEEDCCHPSHLLSVHPPILDNR